uniref:Uncharacterized mitochondrial protein AtMg00810-like n=1 Tax=Nicotiana tabacum TaxID=4097 RepID=A0A1S4BMM4_TOBAC|nr:PREDICTED: uncharacterized mitochondrial protein AtMg00810-like [Nicotiana tabacum]
MNFTETFSPIVKLSTVKYLIVVAVKHGWSLFQLDVNNASLHGDLHEEVYMKLPQGSSGDIIILDIYVDDLIFTGNNLVEISALKKFLDNEFKIKDLGLLHYFLGIEFSTSPDGLKADSGGCLPILKEHLSRFLQAPRLPHMTVAFHMLRYLKDTIDVGLFYSNSPDCTLTAYSNSDWAACPDTRKSASEFCVFLGDCLVAWKSKKQPETEYKALSKVVAELT